MTSFLAAIPLPPAKNIPASGRPAWTVLALAAALACVAAPQARSQTLPPRLPPAAEPGREPPRPLVPQPALEAPRVQVPQSSVVEVPAGAKDLRFVLKDFAIEGATAFPADELRSLYAGLVGREVSVAEVFEAAHAIELHYRNAGYVTSRVIVPQQTVDDGRFRVVVVEGFVADIVYEGDIGPARVAVEKLMGGLRNVRPVRIGDIERRLLLANDLHGLAVSGTLEPSPDKLGGSIIVVRSERKAIEGSALFDNRASPYLGGRKLTGNFAWNAIGERADHVWLGASSSLPTGYSADLHAGYDAQVLDNGTSLSLSGSYARSEPGRELEALDVQSQVSSVLATVTVPLIRSRTENLRAVAQFEARDVHTDIADIAFTRDRLRILRAGLSYDVSDSWNGITAIRGMLHQGISGLGASSNGSALASRPKGHSDFTKFTFDLTRVQQLTERASLLGSFTSQYSRTSLLASEEISLGGANFGRAFDDGEIPADNGLGASLELRYVPAGLPRNVQVYGFVDGGHVWSADGDDVMPHAWLASFGGGVRASLTNALFATLELAKPIDRVVNTQGDKDVRVFVSVQAQF